MRSVFCAAAQAIRRMHQYPLKSSLMSSVPLQCQLWSIQVHILAVICSIWLSAFWQLFAQIKGWSLWSTVCIKCPCSRLRCKPSLLGHKPCFWAISGECPADICKCTTFKTLKWSCDLSCVMYINQYRLSCLVALSWPSCPSAHMIWLWGASSLFCCRLTRAIIVFIFQDCWSLCTQSRDHSWLATAWHACRVITSLSAMDTACQWLFVIVKHSAQGDEMHQSL